MPEDQAPARPVREELDAQTIALRVVTALLLVGAAWLLAGLLVPFVLAMVLAIALSPLAVRIERLGAPKVVASLACVLVVLSVLSVAVGLVLYQAGTMIQNSDHYLQKFGTLLAQGVERVGGDRMVESFGLLKPDGAETGDSGSAESATDDSQSAAAPDDSRNSGGAWTRLLRRNVRALLGWVLTGVGGLVGIVGGVIVFLAFLFYMLQTREEWCDRTTDALTKLGMGPRDGQLAQLQQEIVTYIGCLSLVSLGYMVLVTLVLWAIGMPQPLLWGVLAGLLEFIPYFGPLIASVLPLIVSLSLGSWWQPAAVLGQYVGLHFLESYVVTPLVYGRAVRLNPVTILFAALFFGWIWGPVGLALATPMMILLRGLLVMSPHTPALDAFANVEDEKAEPQPAH